MEERAGTSTEGKRSPGEDGHRREDGLVLDGSQEHEGSIRIAEDVIVALARKTIQGIPHIQAASGRFGAFGLGRKAGEGIRISVENGASPSISVDAYILVKYGQRIPDLAWDVQEKVKSNLERYTGYAVKTVNINVQGIYIEEPVQLEEPEPGGERGDGENVLPVEENAARDD